MAYSRTFGKIGAVVVDMQEVFLCAHDPVTIEKKINSQRKVLGFCFNRGFPIFFLEYALHGRTISELKTYLRKGNCFSKSCDNGFMNLDFSKTLEKLSLDSLILMGVEASLCVRATGIAALGMGYTVLTAKDLIDDSEQVEREPFGNNWLSFVNYYKNSKKLIESLEESGVRKFYL